MSRSWIRATLGAALLAGTVAGAAALAHDVPAPPAPPAPPAAPLAPLPPLPPMPPMPDGHDVKKVIIIREHADGKEERQEIAIDHDCGANTLADVDEKDADETDGDRNERHVRIRVCSHAGEARAVALQSVRHARDGIAMDRNMGDVIRKRVLARLDEAIARLERESR